MPAIRYIPMSCWSERPPNNTSYNHAFVCLPVLDVKNLLLKMLHSLNTGHGEAMLQLSWTLPPWWLAFMISEVACRLLGKKSHQWSYLTGDLASYNPSLVDKVCILVQCWDDCYRVNHLYSEWIWGQNACYSGYDQKTIAWKTSRS